MARGDVWWADFGLPRGSAPALRRPAVVISADPYNASTLRTVMLAVVTANLARAAIPGNVTVAAALGGLDRDSVVNVTQVTALDRGALGERIGVLPSWLMAQVEDGLRRALGL